MKPRASAVARDSAYTLVELLAVISIVALMVALLLPALSMARGAAQSTACLNHQRQIVATQQVYANDNDSSLSICHVLVDYTLTPKEAASPWGDSMTSPLGAFVFLKREWPFYVANTLSSGLEQRMVDAGPAEYRRMVSEGILNCPGANWETDPAYWDNAGDIGQYTYGMNRFVGAETPLYDENQNVQNVSTSKIDYMPEPSATLLTSDVIRQLEIPHERAFDPDFFSAGFGVKYRHGGGAATNLSFVDGHAGALTLDVVHNTPDVYTPLNLFTERRVFENPAVRMAPR